MVKKTFRSSVTKEVLHESNKYIYIHLCHTCIRHECIPVASGHAADAHGVHQCIGGSSGGANFMGGQNLLLWDYGDYYPIMIMVHYYYPIYDDYYDKYSKTCPEEFGIGSL